MQGSLCSFKLKLSTKILNLFIFTSTKHLKFAQINWHADKINDSDKRFMAHHHEISRFIVLRNLFDSTFEFPMVYGSYIDPNEQSIIYVFTVICKHVIACDDDVFYTSTDKSIDTALLIEYQCRTKHGNRVSIV